MTFNELAKSRYSVRKFTGEAVRPEDLEKILEAGFYAPTAKNMQPQQIYVVQSDEAIAKLETDGTVILYSTQTWMQTKSRVKDLWKSVSIG